MGSKVNILSSGCVCIRTNRRKQKAPDRFFSDTGPASPLAPPLAGLASHQSLIFSGLFHLRHLDTLDHYPIHSAL